MTLKKTLLWVLVLSSIIIACKKVPLTGRRQLNLISDSEINSMSFKEYNSFIKSNRVIRNSPDAEMVKRVGENISKAVAQILNEKKQGSMLKDFKWEFNLIESKEVNAWCMPGGKVVVYSGILPITMDEEGLAVVMGHEVAHAIARHGSERMSQGIMQQLGGVALAVALSSKPAETQQLFLAAYGVGSTVGVMLPFSRSHESEADQLGLSFMAAAGYNPAVAVDFWQRMSKKSGGQKPDEFLSTHPSDANRIADIKKHLPAAMKYYKKKG